MAPNIVFPNQFRSKPERCYHSPLLFSPTAGVGSNRSTTPTSVVNARAVTRSHPYVGPFLVQGVFQNRIDPTRPVLTRLVRNDRPAQLVEHKALNLGVVGSSPTEVSHGSCSQPGVGEKGTAATPYDFGAGEVSRTGPLEPGLVYETTAVDYLNFLCYHGYNITTIKNIAKTIPDGFTCPEESSIDLVSNINYPSIAISNFNENLGRKVNRTLTNVVGDGKSVYTVSIDAPADLDAQVIPDKLQFTKNGDKSSYQVSISATNH
ncbi:hypothetical protein F3Y22_tig00111743pilonHSYRG00058 [Hibiscus syriacus]|uniref:Subtilisin-like protease fibronectin type-III domain-containing protein n=1 Tax=Hibiscus syriacus TaxID=106335 RepID=A0A6A2XX39_HIBSY|nr:hypothetical protein F3Y22_tig00111743pilonHSYRG00058 [Hibiscus syriacus]